MEYVSDSGWTRTNVSRLRREGYSLLELPLSDTAIVERDGIRTHGLLNANQALFQMSYGPIKLLCSITEIQLSQKYGNKKDTHFYEEIQYENCTFVYKWNRKSHLLHAKVLFRNSFIAPPQRGQRRFSKAKETSLWWLFLSCLIFLIFAK